MPPLIAKWQQLPNSDKDLFPLLECFTSIAQALGSGFTQFAQPVFQRSILLQLVFSMIEFIVCSLDLLSGLVEGLGSGVESLVAQSNLKDLLLQCCMDDAYDVRQSAFVLLGDLARVCPVHLHPRLSEFLDVAAKQLNTSKLKATLSVANNACWAIGELAVKALGSGFTQFAQPVFQRCIDIIKIQQLAKVDPASAGVQYDKEFIVCSLDLLSGLVEGLGSGVESLVAQSNLKDLLLQCCLDDAYDVRQSAFALLGDLARVCPVHLHPRLSEFLDVAAKQLNTSKLKETLSVANNACWAIGELAVKVRQEVSPIVVAVISYLVPILLHSEELNNKSLVENSAITLGRLAWVCPELVSPHMEHFMQSWCIALSRIRDDIEKEDAFRGLCAMVKANPSGALSSLVFMCRAIASWHEIRSEELHNEVCQVLHGYKQMLRNGAWDQCMSVLEPPVKERLSKYQV